MTKTIVLEKINHMPEALMGVVSDILDKLLEGYELGKQSEPDDFTEEDMDELDRRYQEILSTPSESMPVEDVLKYMRERHAL